MDARRRNRVDDIFDAATSSHIVIYARWYVARTYKHAIWLQSISVFLVGYLYIWILRAYVQHTGVVWTPWLVKRCGGQRERRTATQVDYIVAQLVLHIYSLWSQTATLGWYLARYIECIISYMFGAWVMRLSLEHYEAGAIWRFDELCAICATQGGQILFEYMRMVFANEFPILE